jgi:hypothetical protein
MRILFPTARFVLSMNWLHHNTIPASAHHFMSTSYPLGSARKKNTNIAKPPLKSRLPPATRPKLFTTDSDRRPRGEQVDLARLAQVTFLRFTSSNITV